MKTTMMNMKNNVKMNGFLAAQSETIRLEYVESLSTGDVSVDKMKGMGVVPVSAISDLNSVLAKASYAAEVSKVGATTVSMQVGGTNPRVFFKQGEFNKGLFKKVFKTAGKAEVVGKKYESVFVEGVNKFSKIDFEMGIRYSIYLVNKATIQRYLDEVSMMCLDSVNSVDDIQQVVLDLDPIARALQESSIDVTKDKDKDFGIYATDIIGSEVQALNVLIKKGGLLNNLKDCIKEPTKVKYEATTNIILNDDQEAVDTNASAAQLAILDGTNEYMNNLLDNYAKTTNDDYKKYIVAAKNYRSFVWFIRKITDAMNTKIENGTVRQIRDAIYVEAKEQGVPTEDVIKCAIAAGYTNFYKNADGEIKATSNLNKFRFTNIARLFDDIFVQEYAENKALEIELDIEDVFVDVEEGTVVTVKDGLGYVDGSMVLSLIDVDAEGDAVVREGRLMLQYNPLNNINYDRKVVLVDAFLNRTNGAWEDVQLADDNSVAVQTERLLNCKCGVKDNFVLAINPNTGKALRIARLNNNFTMPKGGVNVKDVIVSLDNGDYKGSAMILIEA